MADYAVCIPRSLAGDKLIAAADMAAKINPVNHPPLYRLAAIVPGLEVTRERIAVMTTKYWHTNGVKLMVGFLDIAGRSSRQNPLAYECVVVAAERQFHRDQYRSAGTDHAHARGRSLVLFGSRYFNHRALAPDDEFGQLYHGHSRLRVLPRRQARDRPYARLPARAYAARPRRADRRRQSHRLFRRDARLGSDQVRRQVLTPLEDASLWGTDRFDQNSIMCYQLPGTITKDGQPILGGYDIDESDFAFMAKVYPKTLQDVDGDGEPQQLLR